MTEGCLQYRIECIHIKRIGNQQVSNATKHQKAFSLQALACQSKTAFSAFRCSSGTVVQHPCISVNPPWRLLICKTRHTRFDESELNLVGITNAAMFASRDEKAASITFISLQNFYRFETCTEGIFVRQYFTLLSTLKVICLLIISGLINF